VKTDSTVMSSDSGPILSSAVVTLVGLVSHLAAFPLGSIGADVCNATKYVIYLGGIAVYNITFHPLRRYPGPLFWAISRLPWAAISFAGKLPFRVAALHAQYGPVVRIAPDELSFIDPLAWKPMLYAHHGRPTMQKDRKY
jgi:hypothetical protein